MGAGLKIDRPLGWRSWMTTWRLLAISMPLTIVAIAGLGWSILGLGLASALLLGSALAPTDPVLASDVQVGPPQSGEDGEVRFSLTSEAGLNDGLSFPLRSSGHRFGTGNASWRTVVSELAAGRCVLEARRKCRLGMVYREALGHLDVSPSEAGETCAYWRRICCAGYHLLELRFDRDGRWLRFCWGV